MRHALLLAFALGLAACTPPETAAGAATTETSTSRPKDEASCVAAGGDWRRVCLMGEQACVIAYRDAGKTCRDGDECQGKQCRYEGKPTAPGQEVTGKCVANSDPCGCFTLVENGKAASALCVD